MTLTEARNNKRGFAGLRTKRTEIPVGTPWNCLHSSATNANFFTIRAQGLRSTYPNQLALQCETQFSFDRTGKFHTLYAENKRTRPFIRDSNYVTIPSRQRTRQSGLEQDACRELRGTSQNGFSQISNVIDVDIFYLCHCI